MCSVIQFYQIHTPCITPGTSGQPQERRLNTVAETLAIIAFLGCGILVGIVLVLTLYIAYKRYKEFLKAESLR